ncbi:RsmE family RNA methyltransferase [Treponema pedis]|uniref:Ribosomal RNA small subunit methyltransferase E n=1 Tax=Treponema pedis str. T A4 TaxID=1291379 RepID=S6A475_9SPIR|nr:16S rRNA (uracil(1498)-N(3))-methyltransferase [Treponema pedis]AGT44161.1 16S ribosomal RNA methyltransferase RsmE [Treponema pedis str. T A4]
MKQFIVSEIPDSEGIIKLSGKDYRYLVAVRRIKEGQDLKVSVNGNTPSEAEVFNVNTEKRYIKLKLKKISSAVKTVEPRPAIVLMQWLIKGQRMDTAIRQCTEAGVKAVFPILGEFSLIREENKNQTERRKRIIREARQQSGSPVETEIFQAAPLNKSLASVFEYLNGKKTTKLLMTEKDEEENSLQTCLKESPEAVILAIGCEGGISPKETEFLLQNGFKQVHFKTNVLRAETAAIYATAAVQTILN